MVLIAPSLLSADFGRINEEIAAVHRAGADWIHLDVMDGRFVPNLTFGPPVIRRLDKPPGVVFDAHLMVMEPEKLAADFAEAGCHSLTVHPEATVHLHRTLRHIRSLGLKVGAALDPATPLETVEWVLEDLDLVLVMSVNPGFGGQAYIPQVTRKIARLKDLIARRGLELAIQVDGGINASNAAEVARAGASVLVAGTAVFGQADYAGAIGELRRQAETARPPAKTG